jgi:hypothetical protein
MVPLAVSLAGGMFWGGRWLWKQTAYKYGNFNLRFISHPPPDGSIHNFWFPYLLPIGKFRLCCFVQSNYGFPLTRLNFRFLNSDSSNVPRSDIEIVRIEEAECDDRTLAATVPDTEGGIDGRYDGDVPALARDESLYFWIDAKASKAWNGKLSFRGQNVVGFRCYGTHAVAVTSISDSPLLADTSQAKNNLPLKVEYKEGVGAFYQETPIHRPGLGQGILQLVRIKVIGQRVEPVNDVQVKVQRINPEQPGLHGLPFHVQRMNDNIQPYQRSTVFAKNQEEYFDVVGYARFMLSTGELHFRRIDTASGTFHVEPCDVFIRITGLGIESLEHCFHVWIDNDNNLQMRWCDDSEIGRD